MESNLEAGDGRPEPDADLPSALPAGTRVGTFDIVAMLARGGISITYRARDAQHDRDIALKEYLPPFAARAAGSAVVPRSEQAAKAFRRGRDRFLTQARQLAGLKDIAGIVGVHDAFEDNGTAYMAMDLVTGESLESRLQRDHRLSRLAIERIMTPLLTGLERAHAVECIHQDIRPANILIDRTDQPTLIDFGRPRKAPRAGTAAATTEAPRYAAPEQFTSARQGPWTDIYALGATLYHCVTGAPPPSALDRVRSDTMVPAVRAARGHYPPGLLAFIDAALKLAEAERPQSVSAWRRLLDVPAPAKASLPAPRRSPVGPRPDGRRAPARGSLLLPAVMLFLAVVGGGAFVWQRAEDESIHRVAAEKAAADAEAKRQAEAEAARKAQEAARAATAAWAELQNSDDPARLRAFARQFPNAPEALLALQRAERVEAEARRRAEEDAARRAAEAARERARAATAAWGEIQGSDDPARLRAFAARFPESPEAARAVQRADQIEAAVRRRAEEEAARRAAEAEREKARAATAAWADLQGSEDTAQLREFATRFAGTPEATLAMQRAAALETAAKRRADEEAARRIREAAQERARAAAAGWTEIQNSDDPARLRDFADRFPGTREAQLALARADDLKATTEGARRTAEPEAARKPPSPQEPPTTLTYPDGSRYVGGAVNGRRQGQGTYTFANGDRYIGAWVDNQMQGHGVLLFANGARYVGEWSKSKKNGRGTYTFRGGDRYVGNWVDDEMRGQGVYTWADGGRYDGEWRNNRRNGRGTRTWPDGDRYEGEWRDDRAHGQGTRRDANGDVFSGRWENGCFMEGNRAVSVGAPLKDCER